MEYEEYLSRIEELRQYEDLFRQGEEYYRNLYTPAHGPVEYMDRDLSKAEEAEAWLDANAGILQEISEKMEPVVKAYVEHRKERDWVYSGPPMMYRMEEKIRECCNAIKEKTRLT